MATFNLVYLFHFKKLILKTEKKPSKMASLFDKEIEDENLFEIDMEQNENNNNEKLPIKLFQELEVELLDTLLHKDNNNELSDDEIDSPIDFIRQIVDRVREEFDGAVKKGDKKTFVHLLTKIVATLFSAKADSIKKIIKLVKLTVSTVVKTWSERN